jgi:ribonuclease BN (tRNA processing enzyme)
MPRRGDGIGVIPPRALTWLLACFLAAACGGAGAGNEEESLEDYSVGAHVVLLGTGTPNAEPDRAGAGLAVIVNGEAYLVDAGPGVVRRASAARERGVEALDPARLETVFLTHLHSDHTVGLPDVIFTPWVLERSAPLAVYGPPGTAAMTRHLTAAYEDDVRTRLDGLEPANPTGHRVEVHEIEPGVVFENEDVRVTAFPVRHGAWEVSFGFRFETADRTVVVSGDAAPSETIVEYCAGCDVLVHEVYSQAGFERRDPVWQAYHSRSHTSSLELAELAGRAEPGLLVLTHQLLWGSTPEELVAEIEAAWSGDVRYGRDLDVY